ncbi:MAG: TIR domain-containing protein [Gammaproteobacteria bacterium]|nr:TIR domain-containing protein [Gammaproteobacteria bacterium]
MSSIFISHSSSDNAIARELERRLERQGHASVFLDLDPEKGIVGGQSWERTLYRKIRACRAVIALVTDDYVKSHWCFAEIALARMEGKFVFALKVDPLSPDTRMPSILTEKQYIDLRSDPEDGFNRLWRGLRRVDVLGVKGEWDPKESPYLGFDSFQEKHAPLFFGREDEARAGVEMLERGSPGLIMTLGPSGSGKSSLVRAAIIPRLRRLEDRWLVVEPFRPGRDPFAALASALFDTFRRYAPDAAKSIGNAERLAERLRAGRGESQTQGDGEQVSESADDRPMRDDERVRRLMVQLAELKESSAPADPDDPFVNFLDWTIEDLRKMTDLPVRESRLSASGAATALIDVANDLRRLSDRNDARVLVVVDQFEELLGEGAAASDAEIFLRFLRESFEEADSPVVILGTMRSDFLGLFQRHPVLRGVDYESLSLGPMSTQGMRRVIEEPAKLGAVELEPGLTDRLISDTETPDALPLLSFTLWVLWRDFGDDRLIQLSEYDELGGLHGAVVREAEALVSRGDKDALRRAFLAMVRLDDNGRFSRKAVAWDSPDLVPVHPLLEQFVARRLLVVRSDGDTRIVEVAHEALFRTWRLLRDWLDQGRSEVLLTQQIARDAIAWEESDHEKDALWRGTRLLQARELLKRKKLDGIDKEFVKKGLQRERLIKGSIFGTAAVVFVGLGALTTYAFNAKQEATASALAAQMAEREMSNTYEEMVTKILPVVRPKQAAPGPISVDKSVLQLSPTLEHASFGESLAILGRYGAGRVLAVAHDSFVAEEPGDNRLFLDFGLKWLTVGTGVRDVLYTIGHCETVSESGNPATRIAVTTIRDLGYSVASIQDLAQLDVRDSTGVVLIVGNAWAAFAEAEIDAVGEFVANGGRLLLVGLEWSWDQYRHPGGFDPCRFNPYSASRSKETERYPMNALGRQFGITYEPGTIVLD